MTTENDAEYSDIQRSTYLMNRKKFPPESREPPDEGDIQAYRAWCADEGIRKQREDEEAAQIMAPVLISVLSDPDAIAAAIAVVLKKKREGP